MHVYGTIEVDGATARFPSVLGPCGAFIAQITGRVLESGRYLVDGELKRVKGAIVLIPSLARPSQLSYFTRVHLELRGGVETRLQIPVAGFDGELERLECEALLTALDDDLVVLSQESVAPIPDFSQSMVVPPLPSQVEPPIGAALETAAAATTSDSSLRLEIRRVGSSFPVASEPCFAFEGAKAKAPGGGGNTITSDEFAGANS